MLAAILLGSEANSGEPCGTAGLRVCLDWLITIWVTPENGLAKAQTSRPLCSTTAFSGSPNGFSFHRNRLSSKPVHSSGVTEYIPRGDVLEGKLTVTGGDTRMCNTSS